MLYDILFEEILEFRNLDMNHIITPVNAAKLRALSKESGYDNKKSDYLCRGFSEGFSLKFEGPQNVKKTAPNLKLRVDLKIELWNKVMVEVKAGRYAGPFEQIPFDSYIQSPIGLVPKDKGTKIAL